VTDLRISQDPDPKYEWYMAEMVKPDLRMTFNGAKGQPTYVVEVFETQVYINGRPTDLSLTQAVQALRALKS